MLARDRRGRGAYSTLFWISFLTFCVVPMVALAITAGRYFYARGEMYKCADAAALAAAQEVDVAHYIQTGEAIMSPSAYGMAQAYADMNSDYLARYKIHPYVTGISVDMANRVVTVDMAGTTSELVPLIGPVTLYGHGTAEARIEIRP